MLRKEDEDEFEQFVTRLRPKTEDVDVTHLTGTIEEASSPTKPQQQFQLRIKDPSALEYIEDEVQSIMSSAVKEEPLSRVAASTRSVVEPERDPTVRGQLPREYAVHTGLKETSGHEKQSTSKVMQILQQEEESQILSSSSRYEPASSMRDAAPTAVRAKILELELE